MKKFWKPLQTAVLMGALIFSLCVPAAAAQPDDRASILFTHDLHSYFLPTLSEEGEEQGGFARLMTAIHEEKEKYPDGSTDDGRLSDFVHRKWSTH